MANKKMKMDVIKLEAISRLPVPDKVLVSILSILSTVESARITILSKPIWKQVHNLTLSFSLNCRNPQFPHFNFVTRSQIDNHHPLYDQSLETALSNFTILQEFCLIGSDSVRNLKIRCNTLKNLKILACCNLLVLELFTPELVWFIYNGPDIRYVFGDVPCLTQASFGDSYSLFLGNRRFLQIQPILRQLVALNLCQVSTLLYRFPLVREFNYVRILQLDIMVWESRKPYFLFQDALKVFKFLDVLSLRLFWPKDNYRLLFTERENSGKPLNLSLFRMDGFVSNGIPNQFFHLLGRNTDMVRKVVVRVARMASMESDEDLMNPHERESTMAEARTFIPAFLPWTTIFEFY